MSWTGMMCRTANYIRQSTYIDNTECMNDLLDAHNIFYGNSLYSSK